MDDSRFGAATAMGELTEFQKPPLSGRQVFALLLALLSLCYISVLATSYAGSDDYLLLWVAPSGVSWRLHLEIAIGRPMNGILVHFLFSRMGDIGDLCYIRFLSVTLIATLAWAVYRTSLEAGWHWRDAFFLSLITAMLPPFQVYASWAETVQYPLAAISAAAAFYMAEWGLKEQRPGPKWSLATGSALFILLSITIVQPGAMFFWVFAAIALFKPDAHIPCLLHHLLWYGAIVATGMILGFCVYEVGVAKYGFLLPAERAHLTKDVLGKALWFVQLPMVDALNLINLRSNLSFACGVAIVGSCGMVLYFRGDIKERLLKVAIALCLIPMSYLPNLLTGENWSSYRTQLALTSLVLVYACFALNGYVRLLYRRIGDQVQTVVLGVAAFAAMLLATYNVQAYWAFPLSLELRMMKSQLTSGNVRDARTIYVIGSNWMDSVAPTVRYDEFGLPFSAQPWGSEPAVHVLLREMGYLSVPVQIAPVGGPIKPPDGALVVDMRKLVDFR
jgi:hypothetical protein